MVIGLFFYGDRREVNRAIIYYNVKEKEFIERETLLLFFILIIIYVITYYLCTYWASGFQKVS